MTTMTFRLPGPVIGFLDVTMTPDPSNLPGSNVLSHLTDGLGGWALIAAMAGVVIGAVMWAFGHYSQNSSAYRCDLGI